MIVFKQQNNLKCPPKSMFWLMKRYIQQINHDFISNNLKPLCNKKISQITNLIALSVASYILTNNKRHTTTASEATYDRFCPY